MVHKQIHKLHPDGLVNGQKLVITDVVGMTELNGNTTMQMLTEQYLLYSDNFE